MSILASRQNMPSPASPNVIPFCELRPHGASSSMRELCSPLALEQEEMRQLDQAASNRSRVRKRDTLFWPGDSFTALYAIRLGTFKTVVLTEDGREQIMGYHMAGEIIGLDGIGNDRYASQAVALEDSEVFVLPFDLLDELAHNVTALRRNLYRFISNNICRGHNMMLMLGSMRAEERLGLFLLNLAQRFQTLGYSSNEFVLRMTRDEIASYLGLKLETVSRLFSRLQEEGLIQVQGRAIKLLDSSALKRLVGQRC
jgi:CRP/FNR family transcriptional regulator, anaerobic regulatory protein